MEPHCFPNPSFHAIAIDRFAESTRDSKPHFWSFGCGAKAERSEQSARVTEALVIDFSIVTAAKDPEGFRESKPFGFGFRRSRNRC